MNKYWFLALIISWIGLFAAGVYVEHKFNIAATVGIVDKQAENLAAGQQAIIKFNEQWSVADAKPTPCDNTTIPIPERRLLH